MKFKLRNVFVAFSLSLACATASADVGGKLTDWFDDMNNSNVTQPGVYEGQTAMYGTLGGVSARTQITRPFEFLTIQTPKFSAGCGGIDAYMGGFTAIDADQFVESLRAVGQNAKSLAFMLAIQVVSPMLSDVMEDIRGFAQEYLSYDMDSCQAAEALVGGIYQEFGGEKADCIAARQDQFGEDFTTASWNCTTGGRRQDTNGANIATFSEGNLAWFAMMQNSNQIFRNDPEFAELVMNIVGTIIKREENPADPDSRKDIRIINSPITNDGQLTEQGESILNAMLLGDDGGTMQLFRCVNRVADPGSCDRVTDALTDVPANYEGLLKKVEDMLAGIMDKIYDDAGLTPQEQALISGTRIPLYKYLAAAAAAYPRSSVRHNNLLGSYSEHIARDIMMNGIITMVEQVRNSVDNLPNGVSSTQEVVEYSSQLDDVLSTLTRIERDHAMDAEKFIAFQQQIRQYEKMVMGKLSSSIVRSSIWNG